MSEDINIIVQCIYSVLWQVRYVVLSSSLIVYRAYMPTIMKVSMMMMMMREREREREREDRQTDMVAMDSLL